ncbi:MAG: phosphodiester glycosidase family protein [Bacteroidales bacterium]|nr:phosphodiester glycosidase family protein [Bacteroidales bacterium]
MNRKLLLLLLLPALTLAVRSCGGGKGEEDKTPEPYITGITTDYDGKAVAGKPVTLNGINFSTVASENKVIYGVGLDATALRVNECTDEYVVFTAPDVDKSQIKVRVSVKGKESNAVTLEYTVLAEPPGPEQPEEPWDDTPTIDFTTMGGKSVTICPGVEWISFHGTWEGQTRNINIVKTTLNEHNHLGLYFNYGTTYPDGYTPTLADGEDARDLDKKCIYLDAIAGTNGPMACCHFVRVNGVIEHAATDQDEWVNNCALTIDGDVVDIVKVKDNYKAARLTNAANGSTYPPDNTLTVGCAGPWLVWEGTVLKCSQEWLNADSDKWLTDTHPRTALGLSKDGKTVIQVAVDGRWNNSSMSKDKWAIGMSCELLGKLMRGLGCYKAMNFDGGGGTAMWVYGQGNSRNIVNRVCENRWNWDGTKLRPTGNAVYIKSDLKQ